MIGHMHSKQEKLKIERLYLIPSRVLLNNISAIYSYTSHLYWKLIWKVDLYYHCSFDSSLSTLKKRYLQSFRKSAVYYLSITL